MLGCQPGFPENPLEDLWLEWLTRMNGDDHFLPRHLTVTKGDVTANLMVLIPSGAYERPDQPIPRKIPGELCHTSTLTVHSGIAL